MYMGESVNPSGKLQIVGAIPFGKLKEIRLSLEAMQFLHL